MGNANDVNIHSLSSQQTFQIDKENVKLSKIYQASLSYKPSFNSDKPSTVLSTSFPKYRKPTISLSQNGLVKAYGVNSYRGLVKKHNEDRVSIILNIAKPQNYSGNYWPQSLSIFSLFDGHAGNKCCDFLRDNFHLYLIRSSLFPKDIEGAISETFSKLENDFLSNYAISEDNYLLDKSGSCASVTIIADTTVYVANIGDSRTLMSNHLGRETIQLTHDHKPNVKSEK